MQDPNVNFFELVAEFDAYWEGREITPGCGYKPFKRWQNLMSTRVDEHGRLPGADEALAQWQAVKSFSAGRSVAGNWQQLGPIIDDLTTRDDIPGVGRMNFVAFHPSDPSIIFTGAPAGGLWRSYDGGRNWTSTSDDLPTLGVSAIAFDPINPDIIYIGTGDRDAADSQGMGVMKSTDGGLNFEFANVGIEIRTVGDLLIHPENPNIIIAATSAGVYKSIDAGLTWNQESGNLNFKDLDIHPTDPNIMYATGNGRFYLSENAGDSWSYITSGISIGSRMVIAVSAAAPERVYVLSSNSTSFRACYQSNNHGQSFVEMSDSPNILGWAADGSTSGGQAWYDLCIEADDSNADILYVGGIRMKKSIDGGATWTDINPSSVHVDQHHCVVSPHNGDLFLANDGGVYHYIDNTEWMDVSDGIVTGQIYKLGQSMHNPQRVLSGFQDNGTMEYLGTNWTRRGGGDGFECFYDPTDENTRYHSIYYGSVYRNNTQVNSQKIAGDGFNQMDEVGAWVTPFTLAPSDENTMFVGLKNIWRTRNIKEENRDSILWERISDNISGGGNTNMSVIATSLANPNLLFVSEGNRRMYRSNDVLSDVPTWTILSNNLPLQNLPVIDIETHPSDSMRLWISFDKRIYESTDMGDSWVDISGSLPEVKINSIVYESFSLDGLYIGTDMGIYFKDAEMEDWVPFSNGFPLNASVREMEIYYGETIADSRIRAATYGRGVWESDLYDSETYYFPPQADLRHEDGLSEVFGDFELKVDFYKNLVYVPVDGFEIEDIYIEGATITEITGGPAQYNLQIQAADPGLVKVFVEPQIAIDEFDQLNLPSDTLFLVVSAIPVPLGIYGPGGVGNSEQLSLWLMADKDVLQEEGGMASTENEQPVAWWGDQSGNGKSAVVMNDAQPMTYRDGFQGINGFPALSFNGVDQCLRAEDIETARDFAFYTLVQAEGEEYNEHGWIASAREANGFMIHPWKDSNEVSANAYNNGGGENMGRDISVSDVSAPHIYGAVYYNNGVGQRLATVVDDNRRWEDMDIDRDESDEIDIRLGRDLNDRWGQGLMSEAFKFKVRLFDVHHRLITNYLGTKYLIDLDDVDYFHLEEFYRYELAGIGRLSVYDRHEDSQGPGAVRFSGATDLEDDEFFLWAHNNGDLIVSEDNFPLLSPSLERVWGFESTGEVGTVNFKFYDDNNALNGGENYGLIVSNNTSFQIGETPDFYPLTEIEAGVWTVDLEFTGIGCFTIGTEPNVSISLNATNAVTVFPNPATDVLKIQGFKTNSTYTILDPTGRVIESGTLNANGDLTIQHISSGVYFLKLNAESNEEIHPFIKN